VRSSATREPQLRLTIWLTFGGSAATARNGILGPASILVTIHPYYWLDEHEKASLLPSWSENRRKTFLDEDYCAIEDHDFFVRGIIHLPIIGAAETLRWGVWGSLGRENFDTLLKMDDDSKRIELPPDVFLVKHSDSRISRYAELENVRPHPRPGIAAAFRAGAIRPSSRTGI
jgi:hypothetical protein